MLNREFEPHLPEFNVSNGIQSSATSAPATLAHFTPKPPSCTVLKEADSAPSSGQGTSSVVVPPTNGQTRPAPPPERMIKREPAFYHVSNKAKDPWRAPGGYYPGSDGTHPTHGRCTHQRPPSSTTVSLNPLVSRHGVSDAHGGSGNLPSPSPSGLPASQQHQQCPFPVGCAFPVVTTTTQTTSISSAYPVLTSSGVMWLPSQPSLVAPNSSISQPPPYPPTTATGAAASTPSPKRKREDAGDNVDSDEASDEKRFRRSSRSDVD